MNRTRKISDTTGQRVRRNTSASSDTCPIAIRHKKSSTVSVHFSIDDQVIGKHWSKMLFKKLNRSGWLFCLNRSDMDCRCLYKQCNPCCNRGVLARFVNQIHRGIVFILGLWIFWIWVNFYLQSYWCLLLFHLNTSLERHNNYGPRMEKLIFYFLIFFFRSYWCRCQIVTEKFRSW